MRREILIVPCLLLVACGGAVSGSSQSGAQSGADGGASGGSGQGGASGGMASAPSANVTPSKASSQSPVPADAPCTVTPGAPTLIFPGHPESFSIDGSFLYAADYMGVSRVPLGGGAATAVMSSADLRGAADSFVLGAGSIYFDPDLSGKLVVVPVGGDAFIGPTYAARSSAYAAMGFDGLNVYSGQVLSGTTIRRWPLDGSKEVDTALPAGALVQAIVAAPDAAYVALLTVTNHGGTSTGSIAKVPLDGSGLVMLAQDVGEPTSIGVDESYLYYGATRGGLETGGLYRMRLDGSDVTTLSEPSPFAFAVDAHSIFFLRDSLIYKIDKSNGGATTKVGESQQFAGVLVNGGNVYWGAPDDGMSVAAGVWTACK